MKNESDETRDQGKYQRRMGIYCTVDQGSYWTTELRSKKVMTLHKEYFKEVKVILNSSVKYSS